MHWLVVWRLDFHKVGYFCRTQRVLYRIVPIWTGTRLLEFDWAYIALSLDANFELVG